MKIEISTKGAIISLCSLVICTLILFYINNINWHNENSDINIAKLPFQIADWKGKDVDNLDQRTQDTLKLDQYVRRIYENTKGEKIFVYVGYWKKQSGDHQAAKHSPLMCLPGNGWKITDIKKSNFNTNMQDGQNFTFVNSELVGIYKNFSALFSYWFFSGEVLYHEETTALFNIIKQTIVNKRSDGGIIELSVDSANNPQALENAKRITDDFVRDFYPELDRLIRPK